MTTSGVTTTELNRNSIIAAALRKVGALAKGQTPDTEDYTNGTEALNNLIAEFMTLGMPLWARKEYTVPMVAATSKYTLTSPFPLRVYQAWTEVTSGGARQELQIKTIYDFNLLPLNSGSSGVPSQFMYQPFINYGELNIWPVPDATTVSTRSLKINYLAPFDTFVSSTDTPYFPREWNNALIYGLTSLLAPEYGMPLQDRASLSKEAAAHLELALDSSWETGSSFLMPERSW